jgi:prevent-host-death family protein
MLTYKANELMSTTDVAKNFGSVISKLVKGEVAKIGVLKNNKPQAVMISIEEYENLQEYKYWNGLDEQEYLAKAFESLSQTDTKRYSIEEADALLEKTIANYEN